jgi:hypothetical protein
MAGPETWTCASEDVGVLPWGGRFIYDYLLLFIYLLVF